MGGEKLNREAKERGVKMNGLSPLRIWVRSGLVRTSLQSLGDQPESRPFDRDHTVPRS